MAPKPSRLTRDEAIAILGVADSAEEPELKRAWRQLALRHHPDKNPGDESSARKFQQATDAYQLLANKTLGFKSYEELAADMDDVREGLERAMGLSARRGATGTATTDSLVKVMKVGPALWVGEVEGGRPHGDGDLILPNGSVHNGSFCNGRAQGEGTFYDASGSVSKGVWVDNKRVGPFSTWDPKLGAWADMYDAEGKRTSRKKGEAPTPGCVAARPCRHCGAKFHATFNSRCRQHSGKWVAASETNADGSPAVVDRVAFPEGGLWLCCGSKIKKGGEPCSIGVHEEHPPSATASEIVPEGQRIEEAPSCAPHGEVVTGGNLGGNAPTAEQGQLAAGARDGERVPPFIATSFSTKVEYEAWVRADARGTVAA